MLLTEINVDDLNTLMHFRIERLLHLFAASLPYCSIQIAAGDLLAIDCPSSAIVDDLLDELEDLCQHAGLILGVRSISIYFGEEEILHANTYVR
jgi:hypothetical protein